MAEREQRVVTAIGDAGDGVVPAQAPGEAPLFVARALPGDIVHVAADGRIDLEIRPTEARRPEPLCPHFPQCGGCKVQHMSDAVYADWKLTRLTKALADHGLAPRQAPAWACRSPLNSRRRAVLTAESARGNWTLGFHESRSHAVVDIERCAILRPAILGAAPALRKLAAALLPRGGTCRFTVLAVDHGLVVDAEPERKPNAASLPAIAQLTAANRILRLTIDGAPFVQHVPPLLTVSGVAVVPPPGAFLQASAEAETAMIALTIAALRKARAKKVLDLFSGLGPFALAVARHASVKAIDTERPLVVALAHAARQASGLKPIETEVRDLFHDPLSPRELERYDAAILDPPRAGAKSQAEALARAKVGTVVMVSCNPTTLARDLDILVSGGYRLESVHAIDQFLFSAHLEAVAILTGPRRS